MSPGTHLAVGVVCALAGVVDAVALTAVARPLVEARASSRAARPSPVVVRVVEPPAPAPKEPAPKVEPEPAVEIELEEPTVTVDAPTKVATVWFASESIALTPAAVGQLRAVAKARDGATLRVVGHADPSGRAEGNEYFSRMRARAVAKALAELGVPADALVTEARGAAEPLDVARTAAARARNRRVDVWQVP